MMKPLWAALPLLLAAAWLLWRWLRGRWPSRHALNVAFSLLLLGYVATTAGLGIFWVANQQLPVFDWHYLFGYGTVLLLALHLAFNFRVVWRFLAKRGAGAVLEGTARMPSRRGLLGAGAALVASGVAFWVGLRHGRTELQLGGPGDPGVSGSGVSEGLVAVERFHAFSSHTRGGLLRRAPSTEWGAAPSAFKRYDGAQRLVLPPPAARGGEALGRASLGTVLWHTVGITAERGGLKLRASPSSGALFSTELYVAVQDLPGLGPGVWHYDPQAHALQRLPGADVAALALRDEPAAVIATAVFGRTGQKYRDRTYRYVLADLGHALENLREAAAAVGLGAELAAGFDGARVAATLGVDEAEEGVLAWVPLRAGVARSAPAPAPPERVWQPAPLAQEAGRPGVTGAVHAVTSLRMRSVGTPAPAVASAPQDAVPLPTAQPADAPVLPLIARRRSMRRFAATPLSPRDLSAVLRRMVHRTPPLLSHAVRVNLVVHAVQGLAPGAYRYEPALHALLPRQQAQALRAAARAAALDQDVIGDAAVAFVLSIDRAAFAADPLGPARGYRHAFLEAGLVGERIYLEAAARGLGACAVGAFYDDEAAALVGLDTAREWVVHFAALGVPA